MKVYFRHTSIIYHTFLDPHLTYAYSPIIIFPTKKIKSSNRKTRASTLPRRYVSFIPNILILKIDRLKGRHRTISSFHCPFIAFTSYGSIFFHHQRFHVGERARYNLLNEGRYSGWIRRLAACILMNSLSNFVFQWRKFLWGDKEGTRGEKISTTEGEKEEYCKRRRWRRRRAEEAVG